MSKVKEITVGGSYTWQPTQYHPVRGEYSLTLELEDGDDPEVVREEAQVDVINGIVHMLAGIDVVHDKLCGQGFSPEDLINEDSDILPDDDADLDLEDWD